MMRQFFLTALIILCGVGLFMHAAEAKRFGGGRNFGMQRSTSSYSRSNSYTAPTSAAAPAASAGRSWLGPLAGLAVGGLLASLFFGHGAFGNIGMIILIAIAAFFIISLFKRRSNIDNFNPTQNWANNVTGQTFNSSPNVRGFNNAANSVSMQTPVGFDKDSFLREAKGSFIRLQAAFDSKNSADLRQFTTPQVFAEINLQLQERGDARNQTDVLHIDAELLDVASEAGSYVASVRFTGSLREEDAPAQDFTETWHFIKADNGEWLVAGVQQ